MINRGLDIDIRDNIKEVKKYLTRTQRRQIPYATSLALNWCAFDTQKALVAHTRRRFRNRVAWYKPKAPTGIHVTKSHKTRLVASVGTSWAPAAKHEEGGVRTPRRGRGLLIPSSRVAKKNQGAGGASGYLTQANVISTPRGVFRRVGGKRNPRLQLLFWRVRRATIKPTYGWGVAASAVVNRKIFGQFQRALTKALRTAR